MLELARSLSTEEKPVCQYYVIVDLDAFDITQLLSIECKPVAFFLLLWVHEPAKTWTGTHYVFLLLNPVTVVKLTREILQDYLDNFPELVSYVRVINGMYFYGSRQCTETSAY